MTNQKLTRKEKALQWAREHDSFTLAQIGELLAEAFEKMTPEEKTHCRLVMRESPLVLTDADREFLRQVGVGI